METQEVYFKGIKYQIIKHLRNANHTIIIAVAWFTDSDIIEVLKDCIKKDISISILYDDNNINNDYQFKYLCECGARVKKYSSSQLMHNKFCIIDNEIVINGSYNWTNNAQWSNRENITITYNNREFVNQFLNEFERLFSSATEIIYQKNSLRKFDLSLIGVNRYEDLHNNIYEKQGDKIILISCYKRINTFNIPEFVSGIQSGAFSECTSLSKIIIPSSITDIPFNCFSNCINLKEITFSFGLKNIGNEAFSGCKSIETIKIPDSVEVIENNAFYECDSLREITLSNNLKEIGNFCFCGCKSIQKVIIPNSVTKIGSEAFQNCTSINELILSKNLSFISSCCFENCTSLKKIEIPCNVKEISYSAFENCANLEEVKFNVGLEIIEWRAFAVKYKHINRKPLKFQLPEGLKEIEESAFEGREIQSIRIPESIETLGSHIFSDTEIENLELPKSIKCSNETFSFSHIKNIKIPHHTELIKGDYFDFPDRIDTIEIPNTVTEIKKNPFFSLSKDMDIIIPNSVTTIKEKAFESITCRKIQIPNSVTKIEKQAFNDCKIKSLVISIDSIEERTFKNANIGEITLCETIKNIEKYAFSKSTIGFIRIPKSMSIIKEGTFDNSEINFIGLPNSIERIEKFAFRNIYTQEIRNIIIEYIINVVCIIDSIIFFCTTKSFGFNYTDHIHKKYIDYFDYHSIRSFYHPLSLLRNKRFKDFIVHKTYLRTNNKKPEDIFNNNLSIYKKNSIIVIPPNCSYISPNAFDREDCYLTVFLPSKLINFKEDKEYKGNFIFYDEIDVSNDNDIYMPHTIKYIKISSYNNNLPPMVFFGFINLSKCILPNTLTEIPCFAFYNCSSLQEVIIPKGITKISEGAFLETNLKQISLPSSIKDISSEVFEEETKIKFSIKHMLTFNSFLVDKIYEKNSISIGILFFCLYLVFSSYILSIVGEELRVVSSFITPFLFAFFTFPLVCRKNITIENFINYCIYIPLGFIFITWFLGIGFLIIFLSNFLFNSNIGGFN